MNIKRDFLIIVFIIIFLLIGCNSINCDAIVINNSNVLIYQNTKFKFSLQFPKSWSSYFMINEKAEDYIIINFIGKSKVSKAILDSGEVSGTTIFYIGNEKYIQNNEFIDSIKKIGKSHKINYYYFTGTDYPIGGLNDFYHDPNVDKKEKVLIYNDYLKAKQMEKDIENILKTFKEI